MADKLVLQTQQWLNLTYGNIAGFDKVPENGQTGWATIYGLIEALQHELNITDLIPNFGDTTLQRFDENITPHLINGLTGNIVYLIQGAFWCKGISPGGFDGKYSANITNAINELQADAGYAPNGKLSGMWARALFDMSAFVLVPGGDAKIREIQQWLNANYSDYFGIIPCDGIYQRDTNTALIYALQAELNYSPDEATGSYGNGTTSRTYPISEGDSGNYVRIVQFGLYVNDFYSDGVFDGYFSDSMGDAVLSFRKFMILPEYTRIADRMVIKGLLSSAGDTDRNADGVDTSTQLTLAQIQTLVDMDVKIIGRYLTGSVGVGSDKHDKFLSIEELSAIFSRGLSVFPIYQDGGWDIDYFNAPQGNIDGFTAGDAAANLEIPVGTVIYFAVDVDIQDGNIAGTILPYFESIYNALLPTGYRVGIYGTRNICNRVISAGFAAYAFVSDMSTGYSGNLGFPMPNLWAFDQFIEFSTGLDSGVLAIDQVAVSGRDLGFNHFEDVGIRPTRQKLIQLGEILPILAPPALGTIEFDSELLIPSGPYNVYVKLIQSLDTDVSNNPLDLKISNGKITNDLIEQLTKYYGKIVLPIEEQKFTIYNEIASNIKEGSFTISPANRPEEPNRGIEVKFNYSYNDGSGRAVTWRVQIYLRRDTVQAVQPEDIGNYDTLLKVSSYLSEATPTMNFIRLLETFSSMTAQPILPVAQTIQADGLISVFGIIMLSLLVLA
ncbi:glycoside hydrolase domain-containing protein [Lactococcus allomyrinae]|uniref:DUF1906 domain-containing protein n=1 Tax=Lactococcus allomyrinae TaxID=2419773 RepID=A0A387BSJ4_9LACT|nr:glycoside hydrolase domain-containing protein [Lactococcus allomyrinae]AYG01441.1 DUF1906 domain-containing protein [Lactococcus allomyrinae]